MEHKNATGPLEDASTVKCGNAEAQVATASLELKWQFTGQYNWGGIASPFIILV